MESRHTRDFSAPTPAVGESRSSRSQVVRRIKDLGLAIPANPNESGRHPADSIPCKVLAKACCADKTDETKLAVV
jgi:hypothetical protein